MDIKILLVFCSFFSLFTIKGQVMWQVEGDKITKWNYFFGDEFNGENLNEKYWYTGPPFGRSAMFFDLYYAKENISLKNGKIDFIADSNKLLREIEPWLIDTSYFRKNNIKPKDGLYSFKYSGGMIWSKQTFKYGYYEARFKAPAGQGFWPAFWLYGQNQKDEIDFFELKGEHNNKVHVDVHCLNDCDNIKLNVFKRVNWGGWVGINGSLDNGFNTISCIWKPGEVIWFLNGIIFAQYKGDFPTRMNIVLNLAVAKDNRPFKPGPNKLTKFPSQFEVDYVRVFGLSDTTKLNITNNFNYLNDTSGIIHTKKIKAKKYLFNRRKNVGHEGFISLYKIDSGKILLEVNGNIKKPILKILDLDNKELLQTKLDFTFNQIDVSKFKSGVYKVRVEIPNKLALEETIKL